MSLIHWWPLNGNLNDYGIIPSSLIMTDAPSTQYINGKIGQCYNFDGNVWGQVSNVSIGTDCTICCWAKTSSTSSSMLWGMQCTGSDYMNLYNSWRICLNVGDSEDNPFKDSSDNDIPQIHDGAWHHFVVVFKGSEKAKLYIDGVYRGQAVTYRNPTMNNQNFTLGTWNYSSHGYYWYGGINDVRIYNHALSAKEIKEISKGLILHYPFNDPYVEETTNLINQTSPITYTVRCSPYKNGVKIDWTNPDNQGDTYFMFNAPNMIPGVSYVFSFDCSGLLADSDVTWAVSNTYAPAKIHNGRNVFIFTPNSSALQLFFDDWSRDTRIDNLIMTNFQLEQGDHATPYHSSVTNLFYGRMDFSNTDYWSRGQVNSTAPTIDSDGNMVLYGVGTDGNHQSYTVSSQGGMIPLVGSTPYTLSVYVKHSSTTAGFNMYFYERNSGGHVKTTVTRFTVGSEDVNRWVKHSITLTTEAVTTVMYAELNCYNSPDGDTITMMNNSISLEIPSKVYDASGYGNNGIQYNCAITTDSRCGQYSLSTDDAFGFVTLPSIYLDTSFTISTWVKHLDSFSSWARIFDFGAAHSGADYTIGMATSSSGGTICVFGRTAGGGTFPDSYVGSMDFDWHLWTLVVDGTNIKLYKDGELFNEFTAYGNVGGATYNYNYLNKSNWEGDGFSKKYYSDFKIYNTALSASDVLAEYNRKASIDKNGNVFTGEFVEKCDNIAELANYAIEKQLPFTGYIAAGNAKKSTYDYNWPNPTQSGLGTYQQGNLLVTLTSDGVRIYSEPNRDGRAQEGSEWNTWGGLCYSPMMNSYCLVKGHRYIMSWHVKGQSSRAMSDVYWTNQVGWGQYPDADPTVHKAVLQPENFQGEMDCMYDFTINDEVWKTTGEEVHSGFEPNTTYLAYAAFKMGYTYGFTGELGTDIYITNLQMIDVTDGKTYKITKDGVVETTQAISGVSNKARIHSSGIIDAVNLEEC